MKNLNHIPFTAATEEEKKAIRTDSPQELFYIEDIVPTSKPTFKPKLGNVCITEVGHNPQLPSGRQNHAVCQSSLGQSSIQCTT